MVNMNLAKKGWNFWDNQGKMKVMELPGLTRMAGGDETLHVFLQHGPPELLLHVKKVAKLALCSTAFMSLGDMWKHSLAE